MATISQGSDPLLFALVQHPRATLRVRALLALSDERDTWLARVHAAETDGFARGEQAGYERGRAEQQRDDAAAHRVAADHVVRSASSPGFRALQVRRWAPRGWRGTIPPGMDSCAERQWLAQLPRRRDRRVP